MAKFQFYFYLDGIDKTTFPALKRIRRVGEDTWYGFPADLQKTLLHAELVKIPTVKNAIASMRSRGSFRNISITMSDDLRKVYADDDGNFVFNDFVLGEVQLAPTPASSDSTKLDSMVSCLERIAAPKQESIKEILRHLLIEKFTSKNKNVESWCNRFEKESLRFELTGRRQIEIFKSCLDPSLTNWFVVTQENLPLEAEWPSWRAEMISNFGDNSFKPVCSAIGYKFIGGSYIDYVVNKEKLLIEANSDLPKSVILDLIVYGLPSHIIKSLNRNNVTSIKILKDKLKKYEGEEKNFESFKSVRQFIKSNNKSASPSSFRSFENKSNSRINVNSGKRSNFNRQPCSICLAKGSERLHSESSCWFKDSSDSTFKSVNNVTLESSSTSSEEETPKNLI
ncbi:hypothetical protein V9T40_008612 [Parthenolecanium corni]|uniref:Uncharacterized protein n=1 Tax=Parthenolecanium corni TaxID=536013 RepID=A0AAN9TQS4_9HEMI